MTGLVYLVKQIHLKDQSRMNVALSWKQASRIDPGILIDEYYEAKNYKYIITKNHPCTMEDVKHSKCVEEFYMNQLKCSLPWLKSYNGSLEKCWDKHKVFDLVYLMSNVTEISTGFYEKMKTFGCEEKCWTTSWIQTRSTSGSYNGDANFSKVYVSFPATDKESINMILKIQFIIYIHS